MSTFSRDFALLCGVLWILCAPSLATPINYSESTSGDLASAPAGQFEFDVGSNTIAGVMHFGVNVPGRRHYDIDADAFAFRLPDGMRFASIGLSFAASADNVARADAKFRFCDGVGDCGATPSALLGGATVDYLDVSSTLDAFAALMPLGVGSYSIIPFALGIAPLDPSNAVESWYADYRWTFEVVRVPEPSTWVSMLWVAIFFLALQSRRRLILRATTS